MTNDVQMISYVILFVLAFALMALAFFSDSM